MSRPTLPAALVLALLAACAVALTRRPKRAPLDPRVQAFVRIMQEAR